MTLTSGNATVSLCASAKAGSMKSVKIAPAKAAVRIPSPREGHVRLRLPALFEPHHHPPERSDTLS
jgi:hypothetical protein